MRLLVIDTETTGLDPKQGHRIIEVAAVEVSDRRLTGRHVHFHVNPEREIDFGATEVHGMTWDDLRDKPRFADAIHDFLAFAQGAQWVIHNAPFDVAFLDAEFERAQMPRCGSIYATLTDTLALARENFPGKRNNLDALCERLGVSNAHRSLHGALLDAELLAEVYLAMTRGQETLTIDMAPAPTALDAADLAADDAAARTAILVLAPSADELAAHREYMAMLDRETAGRCLWLALEVQTVEVAVAALQPLPA